MPLVGECGFLNRRDSLPLSWHSHAGWEFTFALTEATEWELADGTILPLAGGSWSLLPPGVRHHGLDGVIKPMQLCWVVWRPDRPGASTRTTFTAAELTAVAAELQSAGIATGPMHPALREAVTACATDFSNGLGDDTGDAEDGLRLARLRTHLADLLLHCLDALHRRERSIDTAAIRQACALLDEAVDGDPPDMRAIARRVGLGPSRFFSAFRAATGFSPGRYLLRLRCARARRLLLNTESTITSIAFSCGFASSQHCARCFRQHYGLSPSAFRQRFQTATDTEDDDQPR